MKSCKNGRIKKEFVANASIILKLKMKIKHIPRNPTLSCPIGLIAVLEKVRSPLSYTKKCHLKYLDTKMLRFLVSVSFLVLLCPMVEVYLIGCAFKYPNRNYHIIISDSATKYDVQKQCACIMFKFRQCYGQLYLVADCNLCSDFVYFFFQIKSEWLPLCTYLI